MEDKAGGAVRFEAGEAATETALEAALALIRAEIAALDADVEAGEAIAAPQDPDDAA